MKLILYSCIFLVLSSTVIAQTEEFEIVKKRKQTQYELGITALTISQPIGFGFYDFSSTRLFAVYSPGVYFSVGKNKQYFRVSINHNRYTNTGQNNDPYKSSIGSNSMLYSVTQDELRFSYLSLGNTDHFLTPYFSCDLNIGVLQNKSAGAEQYYYYYGFGSGPSLQYGTAANFGLQFNCTKKMRLRLETGFEYNLLRNIASNSYAYRSSKIRWQIANIACGFKI